MVLTLFFTDEEEPHPAAESLPVKWQKKTATKRHDDDDEEEEEEDENYGNDDSVGRSRHCKHQQCS